MIDGKLCEQAEIKLAKGLVDKRRVFNCPGLDTPQSLLNCGTRRGLLARNSRFGHPNHGYMMDLTDYSNVIGEVNISHMGVSGETAQALAPYLSHIRRDKSQHPHVTAAIQKSHIRYWKVTSGEKNHHGTACFICNWRFSQK